MRKTLLILLTILALLACSDRVVEDAASDIVWPDLNRIKAGKEELDLDMLGRIWSHFNQQNEPQKMLDHAVQYYNYAEEMGNERLKLYTGAYMGQTFIQMDKPDSMFYYFNDISAISRKLQEPIPMTVINNTLGIYYMNSAFDYNEALPYFIEALRYSAQNAHKANHSTILLNIAHTYYLRDDTAGLEYAQEAYRGGVESGNSKLIYRAALCIANLQYLAGDYESALKHVNEAIAKGNEREKLTAYLTYADILSAIGKPDEAEKYYLLTLESSDKANVNKLTKSQLSYGDFLLSQGRGEEAVSVFTEAIRISEDNHNYTNRHKLYHSLSEAYSVLGNDELADKYMTSYNMLTDSLFELSRDRSFNELIFRYENEKQKSETRAKELELARESNKFHITVMMLIVILTVLVAIYVLYKRKNNMYRQLVMQYDQFQRRERTRALRPSSPPEAADAADAPDADTDADTDEEPGAQDKKSEELFLKLEELMKTQHIYRNNEISVDMLTELLNTNRRYISRMFTQYAGTSFSQYINSHRIREAVSVLSEAENDIPLKALSDYLGYNSLSSFYRSFQKETGVPPSKYRQEVQKLYKKSPR